MRLVRLLVALSLGVSAIPADARADSGTVEITSTPPGARIWMNGTFLGTTPYVWKPKSFVFDTTKHWLNSKHLETPIILRVSAPGYLTREVPITIGPLTWRSLNGLNSFDYYAVATHSFNIRLSKIGEFIGQNPFLANKMAAVPLSSNGAPPSVESMVSAALNAVVAVRAAEGLGSGFLITATGLVVTNRHVVEGAQTVEIITSRGESFTSDLIYRGPDSDIALVKLSSGQPFPYLRLANPTSLAIGQELIAIGSPAGYQNTVTKGTLSGFREEEGVKHIQTDTAINPGNSGGPLLNRVGEVAGINTWKIIGGGVSGLNFAIHVGELLRLLKSQLNVDVPSSVVSLGDSGGSMTNADVIELAKAGFGDELIITKIRASSAAFTVGTSDLIKLKQAGLSEAVIGAMVQASVVK
jgi:serine protease Do